MYIFLTIVVICIFLTIIVKMFIKDDNDIIIEVGKWKFSMTKHEK